MNTPILAAPLRCAVACALAAAPLCRGQSFNVGPNGARSGDDNFVTLAPPPINVPRELAMAELPVASEPVTFFLNVGTSGRYGPYALADGTRIGSQQAPYTLRMFDYGQHFTLHPAADTNAVFGPFSATNGATFTLAGAVMTVVRFPPKLTVSLAHPDRIAQAPMIGIAPLTPAVIQELYGLRAKYVGLADRVDTDTASAELQSVPRVRSNITGNTFTPVVKTSARDKQNALKGAELSAMVFLEKTFGQAFRIRPQSITDGLTFHFQLPEAGDYVLCATQRVKDPSGGASVGSRTVVWWTALHFDGDHPLSVSLNAGNAVTWRDVFRLARPD